MSEPFNKIEIKNNSNLIFISGQIANESTSDQTLPSSVIVETMLVMKKIKDILESSNLTFSNVVQSNIYLVNLEDLQQVSEMFSLFFEANFPACDIVRLKHSL